MLAYRNGLLSRKTRILDVVYNASNNELVRTKTLVKNCIVQIDAAPFKSWYTAHYGADVGLSTFLYYRRQEDPEEGIQG